MTPDISIYLERRKAAAAIWREHSADFCMDHWVKREIEEWHDCGTTACAIGWLGVLKHDGWEMSPHDIPVCPHWTRATPVGSAGYSIRDASIYFGLTYLQAHNLFGGGWSSKTFYGVVSSERITADMVADMLMAMPVRVWDEEESPWE